MNGKLRGFTLIELMIVVAIVAIIAAIAYPSYRNYVLRSHRADGKEMAMRIASAEERYFTNFNRYTASITGDLGFSSTDSEHGYYTAAIELGDAEQTFTLSLAPAGSQESDQCGTLTINNTGYKHQSGGETNGKCW
jgi:type IV pilus assembly protein PilE